MLRRLLATASGSGSFVAALSPPVTPPSVPGTPYTITNDTKYNAWPVICRIATGDLLLAYTKGDSHHADNTGNAVGRLSSDEGATWGSEFTIYDHASLWSSVYGVFTTSTGRIIATLWRDNFGVSGSGEAGIVYSDNNGSTWSAWVATQGGFTQEAYGAGPAIEVGGNLLITIEGSNSGDPILNRSSHTLKSTDNGATWGSEVTVAAYGARPYYESKLVHLDTGDLLAVHRTSAGTGTHYVNTSTDSGATWSAVASAFAGFGAPSTIQHSGRGLLAVTRRNSDSAAIAYTSIDLGTTWSSAIVLDATMFEMEYGCGVELLDGTILVVYGSQPTSSLTNADIKAVILT